MDYPAKIYTKKEFSEQGIQALVKGNFPEISYLFVDNPIQRPPRELPKKFKQRKRRKYRKRKNNL